jgi:hypothetical protein
MTELMKHAHMRRLVGIAERLVLGTGMSLVLLVAEQLLGRMQRRKS